jgi:hypothetical protein
MQPPVAATAIEDQAGLAAALITASFQFGSAPGLAVFSGIATCRISHLLAARVAVDVLVPAKTTMCPVRSAGSLASCSN